MLCDSAFPQTHFTNRPVRREILDMLNWLQCFSLYAAVVASKYPEKAKELWAYQATLIGEARRCGGKGWLLCDSAFRQQITSFDAVDFSKINQSLYSTTFLKYGVLPRVYGGRPLTGGVCIAPQSRPASGADAGSAEGWKRGTTPQTSRWL